MKTKKEIKPRYVKKSPISDLNKNPFKKGVEVWILAGLLASTFIAFYPALKNNFVNWDDQTYVLNNDLLAKPLPESISYFFTHFYNSNYHPLTMIFYSMEYHFEKTNPGLYHTVNIIIHLLNVILVFWFAWLLSSKKPEVALIVALLFGIHPMHVESVAWISELKDVLFAFFFLGGLISYVKYIGTTKNNTSLYLLTVFLFMLSVLSKPAAIPFPLVLLLIDFYRERKFNRNIWIEKIPFLTIALVFAYFTFKAQVPLAVAKLENYTIFQRILFASYAMLSYLWKFFIPANLSVFYPLPHANVGMLPIIFYLAPIVSVILFFLVYKSIRTSRIFAFGFLFFFINIVLVLQFITVGMAITADRYSYIPYIGLFFIAAVYCSKIIRNNNSYWQLVSVLIVAIAITLSYLTYARCKVWYNSELIWTDVIKQFPENAKGYKDRGLYLSDKSIYDVNKSNNEYDRALLDFNKAIELDNQDPVTYFGRGNILMTKAQYKEALNDFNRAINLKSDNPEYYENRAITYCHLQEFNNAFADFNKSLALNGNKIKTYQNRAIVYSTMGRYQEAVSDYNNLIPLQPIPKFYMMRGDAYYHLNNFEPAIADYSSAIGFKPNNSEAYFHRSMAYYNLKQNKNALDDALLAKKYGYAVDNGYIELLQK